MFLKRMNVKQLGCDPLEAREKKYAPGATIEVLNADGTKSIQVSPFAGKRVPLCVIGGVASGTKSGENRSGNSEIWTALTGTFEGVCIQEGEGFPTGNVFESGQVFLPGGIQEAVEGALENAGEGASVEFAIRLYAVWDDKSPVGYRYLGENLKPPSAHDKLAGIRQLMQPHVKANLGPAPAAPVIPVAVAAAPEVQKIEAPAETPAPEAKDKKKDKK